MKRTFSEADSERALARIVKQGRRLTWAYGILAALGLLSLLADQSWVAIVGVCLPLQVASTEWALGRRLKARPHRGVGQWILWHQLWVLSIGLAVLAILFDWPLDAVWAELPADARDVLDAAARIVGMTPMGYLQLIWQATLSITAGLFAVKIAIVSWRYARWIRQLPA